MESSTQSRNNIYALERDLYHGQFCYDNDYQFNFEEAEAYDSNNGPALMREMVSDTGTGQPTPGVTFSTRSQTESKLNTNRYATKKTIAQGMLDIALLSSNAAQLKYILTVGEEHQYYLPMLVLIVSSIVLQGIVGVLFMIIGAIDINDDESQNQDTANTLNNTILILVFFITVINAFIGGFGIKDTEDRVLPDSSIISL